MVRPMYALEQELREYLNELRDMDRSPSTIHNYDWSLHNMFTALNDFGFTVNPRKVGRAELEFLRDEFFTGTNRYKENQIKILLGFMRWAENPEVRKLHITFGDTSPTRVRWLDDDQARLVRNSAEGIERMVIHCELDLGMRRIELLRLTVGSFSSGRVKSIQIHGKGRNGGKHRQVSWHPDTARVLDEYVREVRLPRVQEARRKNPKVKVPDALFIYERDGELYPYKKTAIDQILGKLGERVGIYFTNHDLRRTCGRMMYRSGARLEQIARIFGHADTKTTIRYLGLDFEDMSETMANYARYQNTPLVPEMVQNELSQEKSGQSGI